MTENLCVTVFHEVTISKFFQNVFYTEAHHRCCKSLSMAALTSPKVACNAEKK